ncbi:hypothetical protein [Stappia stellulata]|uniref:hypothetical protein n=1 Tax=Stappia stellulata TaxID=71235 RepID=UPI0003FD0390|nr:hypothetical protein [Stappia stellulata]
MITHRQTAFPGARTVVSALPRSSHARRLLIGGAMACALAGLPDGPAIAQALPGCAQTGAASVFINGRPMLRLSDVAGCPAGMFEPVPGIFVEGQPAVRLATPAPNCSGGGSADVLLGGVPAGRAGDAACPPR